MLSIIGNRNNLEVSCIIATNILFKRIINIHVFIIIFIILISYHFSSPSNNGSFWRQNEEDKNLYNVLDYKKKVAQKAEPNIKFLEKEGRMSSHLSLSLYKTRCNLENGTQGVIWKPYFRCASSYTPETTLF